MLCGGRGEFTGVPQEALIHLSHCCSLGVHVSPQLVFLFAVVAIFILVFGLYFPRHRRRDMLVAYLGLGIGVLSVSEVLGSAEVSAGLGLGLFGVLSIIRLRSDELDHQEVAYYFAALSLGLLGGIRTVDEWLAPALMVAVLAGLFIGDHPRLFARYRRQNITLDQAYSDEQLLKDRLEVLLGAEVHHVHILRTDFVRDTTSVEVRYQINAVPPASPNE